MADDDITRLNTILEANKDKNFVQRIINPKESPSIPMPDMGRGGWGTHYMGWSSIGTDKGEKYIVYPHIVQDRKTNKLMRLDNHQAIQHAINTGEYIQFDKPEDADWFGKNYKLGWDKQWFNEQSNRYMGMTNE